jgi:hypothetical protein
VLLDGGDDAGGGAAVCDVAGEEDDEHSLQSRHHDQKFSVSATADSSAKPKKDAASTAMVSMLSAASHALDSSPHAELLLSAGGRRDMYDWVGVITELANGEGRFDENGKWVPPKQRCSALT